MSQSQSIEAVDAHELDVARVARHVEADDYDQIGQHEDATLEVVALALAIHVAEEEDAENHRHHVPLWEDEVEGVLEELLGLDVAAANGAEEDEGGDLEQADLKSVGRADLHGKRDVAVHGEGDGVLCTQMSVIRGWLLLR